VISGEVHFWLAGAAQRPVPDRLWQGMGPSRLAASGRRGRNSGRWSAANEPSALVGI